MHFTSPLSLDAYLDRVGHTGSRSLSFETLAALQERHLLSVPYENLDILAGKVLSLEPDDLFQKIVLQRRGGYCFELNRLFASLLRGLGFSVTDYVARFWRDERDLPPKRRHHVLCVSIDGERFLADVGVGGIVPRRPLVMRDGVESVQGDECYRLDQDSEFGWFLMEKKRGDWSKLYSFKEEPQQEKDFLFAHYWCVNAPESPFRENPIVAIRTNEGRNSVAGNELRLFRGNEVISSRMSSVESFRTGLEQNFGLVLPEDFPWSCLSRDAHSGG
jgi:arylamine N-acetyltransferase